MKKGLTLVFLVLNLGMMAQVQVSTLQRRILLDLADELEMKNAQARTQALEKARREGWIVRSSQGNHTIELDRLDPETGIPMYFISESNLNAANTMGTPKLWPGGTLGLSLTGAGVNVGEWDGGAVLGTHQELTGRVTQVDGATTLSDHATHVAGTIMASGVQASAKGMAYQANLRAYDWNSDGTEMATAAANGLLLSNHSYGYLTGWYYNSSDAYWYWYGDTSKSSSIDSRFGYYDATAQSWDQIAFNAPNYLIVKSAGNDRQEGPAAGATHKVNRSGSWVLSTVTREKDGGTTGYDCISYNGVAKNILTIGAVNIISGGYTTPSSVVMSSFSGWGPTDDGRIKPDVVSPGVSLYSSGSASNTSYTTKSGTSMASPAATGSLLLVQQHANSVRGSYLRAATLKGLTIHTADEAGTSTGPDYRFGWGLINTSKAAEVISNTNFQNIIRENTLSNGTAQTLRVYSDGTSPLKATICWADPAATPNTLTLNNRAPRLINDLDVRIYREGTSDSIFPYRLDPANPANAATTGDNVVDNVEQVLLNTPTAGYYIIRVSHKRNLQSNAAQNYSMIVTGGNANTLVLNNIPSYFKLGTTYTLSFSKTGTFGAANAYTIEFIPTSGGSNLTATTTLLSNDSVSFSMPAGFIQGISYQIRLKSSLPIAYSSNSSVNISYLQSPTIWASKSSACALDTLTLVTTPQSAASIIWLRGTTNIGNIPTLAVTGPGNYSIRISDAFQQLTSSNLIVTAKATTSTANAGTNQIGLRSTSVILNGSTPSIGEKGKWRKSAATSSSGNFVDDTVRNTTFNGVLGGVYDLIWQHQGDCGNTEDTVRIEIDACTAVNSNISISICAGSSYFFNGSPRNSAGTYLDTLVSSLGCDSVVTLTLNVNQPTSSSISATICQGNTYSFGGVSRSVAGTYSNTLVGANGCDSVVTLELVVNPVTSTVQTMVLCEGDTLTFGALSITTSGIYSQVLTSSLGCDSTVQLAVNVVKPTAFTVFRTICEGDSSFLKDEFFSSTGSYSKTFSGSNGCDSVVTLQLTVLPKSSSTTVANFCSGGTYDWNGTTYSAAGTYTASFPNSVGCDSTATLILNEIQPQFDTVYASICPQGSFDFNGTTITNPGTYVSNLKGTLGCDSTVTLILSPRLGDTTYFSASICEGSDYTLDGTTYREGGEYELFYRSSEGCDSVVYFTLNVLPASNTLIQASICSGSSYVFQGVSYNTSGTYSSTLIAQNGCDSVITLDLTVNPVISSNISASICAGSTYAFGGQNLNTAGTYVDSLQTSNGCDSVVTLNLTVNPVISSKDTLSACGSSVLILSKNLSSSSWIWNTGDTTSSILATQSGWYWVNSSINGCFTKDSTLVDLLQLSIGNDTSICAGNSLTLNARTQLNSTLPFNLQQGLVGYWPFNGNAFDVSGNGINLLNYGSSFVQGKGSKQDLAIQFDGNNDYLESIQPINVLFGNRSRTISVWVKSDGNLASRQTCLVLGSQVGCFGKFNLNFTNSSVSLITGCGIIEYSGIVDNGNWNHLACVFDSSNGNSTSVSKIYLNGVELTSIAGSANINDPIYTLIEKMVIGKDGNNDYFKGKMDDVAIWGRALNQKEITQLFQQGQMSYLWSNGDTTPTISVTPNQTTMYYCTVSNGITTCTDSIRVVVNSSVSSNITASICAGSTYAFGGQILNTTGTYVDSLQTSNGCDSVVTLDLTVNPVISSNITASICAGSTYAFGGRNLNTTGTYVDSLQTSNGCDSVVTLQLTVNAPTLITISTQGSSIICSGSTINITAPSGYSNYLWNTGATTSSISVGTAGDYSVSTTDSSGCAAQSNTISIEVQNAVPARPVAIVGELNPCGFVGNGQTLTYSTDPIPNALSYSWLLTDGIAAVGRTDSNVITVTYPTGFTTGQIRVTPVNACGNGLARAIYPKLASIATVPLFTQSVTSVCNIRGTATTATYSIQPISGCSSYQWTIPTNTTLISGQGTTSIQVTFGSTYTSGAISVIGLSSCGNSPSSSVSVVLLAKPIISGANVICPGDQVTYTIPVVPGAIRYRFNLPAGLTLVSQNVNSAVIRNTGSFISGNLGAQVQTTLCGWSQPGTLSLSTAACRSSVYEFSLRMYPNPTSGELQLQFGVAMKNVQVSVYGSDGRLMKWEIFGGVASQNLNCSSLAEGLYHVEVLATDAENNIHRRMEKVIIQR